MNVETRKILLEATNNGGQEEYLRENTDFNAVKQALSDRQSSRITSSLTLKAAIIPISEQTYKVISKNSNNEYTVNTRVQTCTCNDFLYNCEYTDGEKCKHLWRTILLQKINAVPVNENPRSWLFYQLERDQLLLESKGSCIQDDIKDLQNHLKQTSIIDIDFVSVFSEWQSLIEQV